MSASHTAITLEQNRPESAHTGLAFVTPRGAQVTQKALVFPGQLSFNCILSMRHRQTSPPYQFFQACSEKSAHNFLNEVAMQGYLNPS